MRKHSPNGTYWKKRALAAEAKLDRVMLEFCPDEMTGAQRKRWAFYQRPELEHAPPGFRPVLPQDPPCKTCNDDPVECSMAPGLRHCEKAQRTETESEPWLEDGMAHYKK